MPYRLNYSILLFWAVWLILISQTHLRKPQTTSLLPSQTWASRNSIEEISSYPFKNGIVSLVNYTSWAITTAVAQEVWVCFGITGSWLLNTGDFLNRITLSLPTGHVSASTVFLDTRPVGMATLGKHWVSRYIQIQHLSYLVQHERKNQVPCNILIILCYFWSANRMKMLSW